MADLKLQLPLLEREDELLDLARRWHNNVRSAALAPNGRSRSDHFERARRTLTGQRADTGVRRDLWHLLAAVELLIEDGPIG